MKTTGNSIAYIVSMGNGLESFIYREVDELIARRIPITLFATKFKKGDIYAPKSDWPYHSLSSWKLLLRLPLLFLQALLHPRLFFEAIKNRSLIDLLFALHFSPLMKKAGITQIHCHFGDHKLFVGYYCKRLTGLPLSVTIHSHELHVNPNEKMFQVSIKACDRVLAISDLAVGILRDRYRVDEKVIFLSRLFVDSSTWRRERPLRVLTVARFQPQKGFDDLFAAAKILADEPIEFVVIGFGPLDVKEMAQAEGVADKVIFFDKMNQAQLQLMYQLSDIYCLPSITHPEQGKEGVPVVLMEAMACGLPVVATRCGAVDEIVEDILVPERSPEKLAAAIRTLALDPDLRRRHGDRNREIVEEKYSKANLDIFADNLLAVGASR